MSFQIHLDFPPEVEVIIQHFVDLNLQACHDLGEFFGKLPLEELQGTNTLSQRQKQSSSHAPFLEVEKPSQDEWGGAQDTLEAALLTEKNLKQALLGLCGLFSACANPRFCRFLEG
ncbi:ferritin light chain-like [Oryx dammah]|uniref:ferritin light chain-like n=1 Tax=Oryx dammah TaxID=59534 RepID=UPI001A9A8B74|nr:ferritin light chain-like [Oryx dammah]